MGADTEVDEERKLRRIETRRPDPELVQRLEMLLEDAKRGEVVGFCGVLLFHEGQADYAWFDARLPGWDSSVVSDRVIGALERMKFLLLSERHQLDAKDTWELK